MTATRGSLAVPCYRNAAISPRRVAFLDEVRRDLRVLGARHAIALTGDIAAVETHGRGARFDFAAVVGVVTDADQVHHKITVWSPVFKEIKSCDAYFTILLEFLRCHFAI